MKTITVELPDDVALKDWEASMILASHLYADGKITAGQGAEMTGMSKQTFIEMLGKFGVNYFNQTPEELEEEVRNAANCHL
ncbi:MAG: UPF0175 family protein [Planctomycetaceae bacterium]|nr:UPF0175 family protein [Planctomycetaceae bacterium]